MRLRFVTWNIHSCVGTDGRYDPARIVAVLADLDADVIGLQEVDWRSPPHAEMDQFAYLSERLKLTSLAGPNLRDHRGQYGNGLLTRLAVRRIDRINIAVPDREPRGAIDARLEHCGRQVRVLVTHLGLTRRERRQQLDTIAKRVGRDDPDQRRVLLGDMNIWALPLASRRPLVPGCFSKVCTARTFPARYPLLPLDRIYVGPPPQQLTCRAIRTPATALASDHLPLVADIEWSASDAPIPPQLVRAP